MYAYVREHTQSVHVKCLLAQPWYIVSTQKTPITFIRITIITILVFLVLPFASVSPTWLLNSWQKELSLQRNLEKWQKFSQC